MKKLSFVFTIFLLIFLTACEMEVEDIKRTCTLQNIKVDASMAKLKYYESDSFSSTGLKIYGYYSDNTIKEIDTRYADIDGFPKTKEDIKIEEDIPITVSYGGFSDSYNIQFQDDYVLSLEVDSKKQYYVVYEEFNPDDIIVKAIYKSEKKIVIDSSMYSLEGFNTNHIEEDGLKVKIIYENDKTKSVSYEIFVFANKISELTISKLPNKTKYTKKEGLDFTGLQVNAIVGGRLKEIQAENYKYNIYSSDDTNFENPYLIDEKLLEPGRYKIVFFVDDVYAPPFEIEILEAWQIGMALDFEALPKLIYYVNEDFDITQYKFRKFLSDESLGEEIDIEKSNLKIKKEPDLSVPNKKITITVTSDFYNIEEEKDDTAECSFDIFVTDANILRIEATWKENPKELGYFPLGTKPSDATYGTWTVKAIYSDTTIDDTIPNEYCKFEFADEKIKNGEYDDFYSQLAESEASTVNYLVNISFYKEKGEQYSCTCYVPIGKPEIINAEMTKYPTVRYTVGQTFDPKGLTIKVTTSDNNTEYYIYGEETSKYFTISSNEFTKSGPEEVKIVFEKNDYIYETSIWVNVFENKPIALGISPLQKKIIYLRKKSSYTNAQYKELFKIEKVYESGQHVELTKEEYEKVIIYFEQTNKQHGTDPIWYGSIYAIFNDDSQNSILGKYECLEDNADGLSNNPVIFIIPPLPQNITMDNKKDNNKIAFDSNDFAESLTSKDTKYNIIYKDGSTYEITGNRLKNAIVNYNSINYRLDITQNMVKIHYETVQSAAFEPDSISGEYVVADYSSLQTLDRIKSLRVIKNPDFTKENPDNKYYFIKSKIESKNNSYNLNNYFKASVTYFTGVEQEVTGDKLNYLHFSLNDKENGFKVKYEDGASKAEAEINGITILKPITINNIDQLKNSENLYTNVKFSFKDELGSPHDNFKIENSELPNQTNFIPNKPIKVSLSKNDDNQKYFLTIPGSIEDIDGQVGNYEIELFEDFVTGLVCENGKNNIIQTHFVDDNTIKNLLSSSFIKIRKFFDTNPESISAVTDGSFSFSEENENTNTQINITYTNESEILPLSDGPKAGNLIWNKNESEKYRIAVNLYPAIPTKGETCRHNFDNNNNTNRGIKFTYENEISKYERFYYLYINGHVNLLDSNDYIINTVDNINKKKNDQVGNDTTYSNAFDSDCKKITVTINDNEYSIGIERVINNNPDPDQDNNNQDPNQGNNNQDPEQGNNNQDPNQGNNNQDPNQGNNNQDPDQGNNNQDPNQGNNNPDPNQGNNNQNQQQGN